MKYYDDITNHFPGEFYPYVRVVSLYDEYPFEHQFFIRIKQSFPFMKKLTLINRHVQNHKQSYKSMNDNLLGVDFKSLEKVTHHFTKDDTRINCAKINEIYLFGNVKHSKSLHNYFPFAKIH
jgi:hypothetical protein